MRRKNEIAMFITPHNEIVPGEIVKIIYDNQIQSMWIQNFIKGVSLIQIIVDLEIYDNPLKWPFSNGLLIYKCFESEFPNQADVHLESWEKSEKRIKRIKSIKSIEKSCCLYNPKQRLLDTKFDTFECEEFRMTRMRFSTETDSMKKATVKNALRWAGFLYGLEHGQYERKKYYS